ncbi:hypothetical protein ElyMa_004519400 [Elysia marginata]|uniref:Uncharacterized protein n=1 Tax=Elysia marginata TaxID=1093978 RepID=A0AAV4HMG9_9GAST|nr:hypothetical protein ElyMa_004519400 [Elysia marginata]
MAPPGINISIGDYINNYAYSVNEMRVARQLPVLIPTVPFPDPYLRKPPYGQGKGQVEQWPCSMSRPETRQSRRETFYPRRRDWIHDWAEKMYRIGEFGAKQEHQKLS